MTRKSGMLAVILAAFFMVASAVPSKAMDRDDDRCQHRVQKAEQKLDKAVRKHGENSPQAERRRHELEAARARCHHDHDDHR